MMRRRLIIFLKAATLGQVKTRLAEDVGHEMALSAYRAMVDDLLINLTPSSWESEFYLAGEVGDMDFPFPGNIRRQTGLDLGARMDNALSEAFSEGVERAILIGSDIPQIDSRLIEKYFRALDRCPMVLGPTEDGGYYLIGFRSEAERSRLFGAIEWSTPAVLGQTLERASESGLSVCQGRILQDIDYLDDLEALLDQADAQRRLPHLYRLFRG